jgi:hypothetical protein
MNLNTLKEYMRLHLISLEQDMVEINSQFQETNDEDDENYLLESIVMLDGQIQATKHLLSVAEGKAI